MTWHDLDTIHEEWVNAPLDDGVLGELLEVAKGQVIAYAPKSVRAALDVPEAEVPANLRLAQRRHVENMWNAGRVDTSGGQGEGDFIVRPHPLDWHVKALIRPKTAVPRVR